MARGFVLMLSLACASALAKPGNEDLLSPEEAHRRDEGIAAMDHGRFDEAERIFGDLLEHHAGNAVLRALHAEARNDRQQSQQTATLSFANVVPKVLDAPPWGYRLVEPAKIAERGAPPRLQLVSVKPNQITDDDAWFTRNQLRLPALLKLGAPDEALSIDVMTSVAASPAGIAAGTRVEISQRALSQRGLPLELPAGFGDNELTLALEDANHYILVYGHDNDGRYLAVVDRKTRRLDAFFDFAAYLTPPRFVESDQEYVHGDLGWAEISDGVLYVSTGHRTYARSSMGKNAFLSAIELSTGRLLWQSAPLVSNARNFVLWNGYVLAGYGFTAEKDFLYVLDRATGKSITRIVLKKSPSFLVPREDKLFVRTYSYDYVFSLK